MSGEVQWTSPVETPQLPDSEVHIWRASLEMDSATLIRIRRTLAEDEKARSERFIFDRDRNHFIAGRGILRELVGRYLQRPPQTIDFVYGPRGKPALANGGSRHPICFNISHSHGLAVIGIAREREIGIDVELIRPEFTVEEIAKRYFSVKEVDELNTLPSELRPEGFFHCWTRKEAYIKAKGDGLHIPLDSFDVSLSPGLPAELNSPDRLRWSLRSFAPSPGYVGAIVGEGNNWRSRYLSWTYGWDCPTPTTC
ncbi:MAG: 4'-phosphopantetheinyl transferase superfamily protein [Candidatus Acidiferrales bacterium]